MIREYFIGELLYSKFHRHRSETNLVFMNITVTAYHCVHYGNIIAKSEDAYKFDILTYNKVLIELLVFI